MLKDRASNRSFWRYSDGAFFRSSRSPASTVNTIGRARSLAYKSPLPVASPSTSVACDEPEPILTVAAGASSPYFFGSGESAGCTDLIWRPVTRETSPSTALESRRPAAGSVICHSPFCCFWKRIVRPAAVTSSESTFWRSSFRTDLSRKSNVPRLKVASRNEEMRKTFF